MNIELTDEQTLLLKTAVDWYYKSSEQVFQYTAPAGGGKSLMMHLIIQELGLKEDQVAPMAYTGAASVVMKTNGFQFARTIHWWLYELQEYMLEDPVTHFRFKRTRFVPSYKKLYGVKLICIDEAGMVPESMKKEILKRGIKVLVCGDINQLPPIKDNPAFLYKGNVFHLTKIMRQAEYSAIVYLSQLLLHGQSIQPGNYGDVTVITREQLTDDLLFSAPMVICGTNKSRDEFNKIIRELRGYPNSNLPCDGEKIICRKNDWNECVNGVNLANGLVGRVLNNPSIARLNIQKNVFYMNFVPDMFPDIVFEDLKCDYDYFNGDHETRESIKSNRVKVPQRHRGLELFELGYAITTHLSQGSQYMTGIYHEDGVFPTIQNRLNYTGITRFRQSCIYVLPFSQKTMIRKIPMLFNSDMEKK